MRTVTAIGLDIAKSVFQVHGVDAVRQIVIRHQLKRRSVLAFFQKLPACLVCIEACASSYHRSCELKGPDHTEPLMPPAYVRPYVKLRKNDAIDAEANCEAVVRAMRFVPTKTPEQQNYQMDHRARHLSIRRQTAAINAIRARLAELGLGNHGQRRALKGTHRTSGVNEIASDIRRDVRIGKGEQHVMQSRSIWWSGQPTCVNARSNACF